MNFLREAINDPSGRSSSKRLGLLLATFALSLSIVMLSIAQILGYDAALALGAVAVPLAGLNGYSYVRGIHADKQEQK
jgi:hypothetical protein